MQCMQQAEKLWHGRGPNTKPGICHNLACKEVMTWIHICRKMTLWPSYLVLALCFAKKRCKYRNIKLRKAKKLLVKILRLYEKQLKAEKGGQNQPNWVWKKLQKNHIEFFLRRFWERKEKFSKDHMENIWSNMAQIQFKWVKIERKLGQNRQKFCLDHLFKSQNLHI